MKTTISNQTRIGALALLLLAAALPVRATATSIPEKRPLVQVAILLDTSSSMEGLIEQAKGQLWKIVNEFASARQHAKAPEVQVALFEYGKSTLPGSEGFIRMIQPLTTDLDKISEELFSLKTNGGDEYCGWVIREAVNRLQWSTAPDVYRAIFIAGNEPFTQGQVPYTESCKAAITKGIIVNTIHCGGSGEGIATKWQDGALLADGKYLTIDQNKTVAHVAAPQDAEILRLSTELNKTYLAFGVAGRESLTRQSAQDANALSLAPQGAAVNRALAKASSNYRNANWDLVDALKEKKVELSAISQEELPAEMKNLGPSERQAYVDRKAKERAELQAKINQLNQERAQFVAQSVKNNTTNTLDAAVVTVVREQAAKRNFSFN